MKRVISFIIMNMISTTMVFAHETRLSTDKEMINIMNTVDQLYSVDQNVACEAYDNNRLINKIEKRIAFYEKKNFTLDSVINYYVAKYNKVRKKQVRKTRRILKKNSRINRHYKRALKNNPELAKADFVQKLKLQLDPAVGNQFRSLIKNELIAAGSMQNYLTAVKESILNCQKFTGFSQTLQAGNDTWYLILLILFIGLPVLSILGALFAVIMAAWTWALGFLVFAVVMLLALLIWSQFDKSIGVDGSLNDEDPLIV